MLLKLEAGHIAEEVE
jgi:hypothetical protein